MSAVWRAGRLVALCMAWLWGTPAGAQTPVQVADALSLAVQDWGRAERAGRLGLAVLYKGQAVGIGIARDTPVETASLSKAVTAVCAGTLMDEGRWRAQTLSTRTFSAGHSPVALEALVTHTSGLWPDSTQGLSGRDMRGGASLAQQVGETALTRPRRTDGGFAYNNENYAILGAMIAAELDEPYAAACQSRALAPAGAAAEVSAQLPGALPWGGWRMSPQAYAQFVHHWFGPQGRYGAAGAGLRPAAMGGGAFYGMGMMQRPMPDHVNHWHFGAWCVPGAVEAGSFAAQLRRDWTVVVTWQACVSWEAMAALDAAVVKVIYDR